jgi:hypothetical protein
MSTITNYSDLGTKQNNPTPKQMLNRNEETPISGILTPIYTTDGSETTSYIVGMIEVRKGTKVFSTRSKLRSSAQVAASAFAVNVGYEYADGTADADYFATALDINSAGEASLDEPVVLEFAQDGWITFQPSTVTGAVTADVTITGEFFANFPY